MNAISPQSAAFPGLVDSHCHLDFPDFDGKMAEIREEMRANGVTHALCISVNLAGFPKVLGLAEAHDNFFATVGVHPDHEDRTEVDPARLVELAHHPRVVAIGETGRSEEHTSELQSHLNLVCRLLLEKKKKTIYVQSCLCGASRVLTKT